MNIKSEEAHRLARELSAATGESVTMAVTVALQERLDRMQRDPAAVAARLLDIGRATAPLLREPYRSADHADLLYDERGLPR